MDIFTLFDREKLFISKDYGIKFLLLILLTNEALSVIKLRGLV